MNIVVLDGNLTRDPIVNVVKANGKDVTVAKITIAENRKYKKADGTWGEQTNFIQCEAWDTGAENLAKKFVKGDHILIEGNLRSESWDDKATGEKKSATKVRIDHFQFIPRGAKAAPAEEPQPTPVNEEDSPKVNGDTPF